MAEKNTPSSSTTGASANTVTKPLQKATKKSVAAPKKAVARKGAVSPKTLSKATGATQGKSPLKSSPSTKSQKSKYPWLATYPQGVKWDADIQETPLYDILSEAVKKYPTRNVLNFLGKTYTYQEVSALVDKAAKGLQAQGIKKGSRVGLFLPNCPVFMIFYYAATKIGATVVNFSPLYATREVAAQIEDSEVEIMVTLDLEALYPKIYEMFALTKLRAIVVCPLKDQLPFPKNFLFPLLKSKEIATVHTNDSRVISFATLTNNDGMVKPVKISPRDDIALIQYTGGTTGLPKGAMLTHANVTANANQAFMWFDHNPNEQERILAALPLFHVFAMTAVMNFGLKMGAEIVMMFPRFNAEDAMKMIQKHKITFFPAVPTIYNLISNHPDVKKYDLSSIKACLSGGAALPVEVKREFEQLTGCKLVEAYGLSETSPAATANPMDGRAKEASIGIPFPGTVIKIMSLEDPLKEVPLGEKGEICVQGPQVMKGYWNRPAETGTCLIKGLFHTGDVGYMDAEGYTFLVDRIKDLIICSGYNVYPRVIEEAIYLHPAVAETTVIGIPDNKRGETPKAFVKLREGHTLTEQELIEFLKKKISPIEIPTMVEFRDELPKTIIGKLSKKELVAEEAAKRNAGKS